MIPIEDKDPIEKLGIQKGSDNYKTIQAMLDKAREDEALKFGVFLLSFVPNPQTNGWISPSLSQLVEDAEFSTEQLYSLFKSKV